MINSLLFIFEVGNIWRDGDKTFQEDAIKLRIYKEKAFLLLLLLLPLPFFFSLSCLLSFFLFFPPVHDMPLILSSIAVFLSYYSSWAAAPIGEEVL